MAIKPMTMTDMIRLERESAIAGVDPTVHLSEDERQGVLDWLNEHIRQWNEEEFIAYRNVFQVTTTIHLQVLRMQKFMEVWRPEKHQ